MIRVRVKVKFRAFGVTFGTVDKSFWVSAGASGVGFGDLDEPEPVVSQVVFDKKGVRISVW